MSATALLFCKENVFHMGFLVVNAISIAMFIIILLMLSVFKSTISVGITIAFALVWLFYTVGANVTLLKGQKAKEKLKDSDRGGFFKKQIDAISRQYESIKSREEFFADNTEDSMKDMYYKILEQMHSNIDSAAAYIETYDYYTKPEPSYLNNLCEQGDILVNKFNRLVEQIVDIDTNLTTLDMAYVDDLLSCLEEVKKKELRM